MTRATFTYNIATSIPAEFFEKFSLYQIFVLPDLKQHVTLDRIGIPSITMECEQCASEQTFLAVNRPFDGFSHANHSSDLEIIRCLFLCGRCQSHRRQFFVHLDATKSEIMKVGQHPAWDIRGDKKIEKLLGNRRQFWRRGFICETQGYGIGAFSYYRRIVELIIGDLLDDLRDSISPAVLPEYEEAIVKVKAAHQASEKINIAKDLLPSSLRPSGMNPLGQLYETLSEGIHSYDDAKCLVFAQQIRVIMTFLVREIEAAKEQRREYVEAMGKLLTKKRD